MKASSVVLTLSAGIGLALLTAVPASAAGNSIDPGDSLYAINCDSVYNDWQFFGVDSTTAFSTPIGDGTGSVAEGYYSCAGQAAYNPVTGRSYYIQWFSTEEQSFDEALASVDVSTGESTQIDGFYWNNGEFPEYIDADAMAIGGDGAAYVISDGFLWDLDLETAVVTPIGETVDNVYAFAWDSVTGGFYGITYLNEVYLIDVTDGTAELLDSVVFPDDYQWRIYSLQFDEAGTLWVEVDQGGDSIFNATLWSLTFATLDAPVYSGIFTDDPFYTESLLIVPGTPEPVLAATGIDATPIVAGGLGLLALGGLAIVLRRRAA